MGQKTSTLSFIKERLRVILVQTEDYAPDISLIAVLAVGDVNIIDILKRASGACRISLDTKL